MTLGRWRVSVIPVPNGGGEIGPVRSGHGERRAATVAAWIHRIGD
nr:MAG TPA: hypothetical protein [Caudoviricetes sp.]